VVPVTVADDTLETVALLPLNAPDPGMSQGATAQAAQGLRDLRVFKVVDPETIAGLLGAEALRQSTGCSDASCLAELAGAVGASYVVSGTISQSGEDYTINLVLTDQRSARALDGVVRQEKSAKDIGPGVRLAAQRVVQKLLANKLGTLRVISQEKGADVKIDDVLVGTTPLAPLQFPMGPHKVSVEKTGFIANRQEVVVRPNEVVPVNAELIPSQEFINGYRAKNRVLRILAWLGAGLTGVALTSGVAAYAGWMGLYLGFNQQSPEDALVALVTPPNPRNGFPGDLVVQSTSLKKDYQWMWLPMDLLAAWMLVAPALALGAAVFGGVFWLIGDDPGRYNRYSE
jgi:TolB-like protein